MHSWLIIETMERTWQEGLVEEHEAVKVLKNEDPSGFHRPRTLHRAHPCPFSPSKFATTL